MLRQRTRVGPKGQAVIPKPIRDKVRIHPNDELEVSEENGRIIMKPIRRQDPVAELFALVPNKKRAPKRIDWDEEYGSQFR